MDNFHFVQLLIYLYVNNVNQTTRCATVQKSIFSIKKQLFGDLQITSKLVVNRFLSKLRYVHMYIYIYKLHFRQRLFYTYRTFNFIYLVSKNSTFYLKYSERVTYKSLHSTIREMIEVFIRMLIILIVFLLF